MSSRLLKSIEKLHLRSIRDRSSVIYIQRDTDKMYITNGYTFNKIFSGHKFVKPDMNEAKVSNDSEIYIRIKDDNIFFETEDHDLINIE